jgi:hypothetical protein
MARSFILSGKRSSTADIDAIRFVQNTGNMNGSVRVYGYN